MENSRVKKRTALFVGMGVTIIILVIAAVYLVVRPETQEAKRDVDTAAPTGDTGNAPKERSAKPDASSDADSPAEDTQTPPDADSRRDEEGTMPARVKEGVEQGSQQQ